MIRKYLFLLIFLMPPEAQAMDNLGRLFLTPEQRAQLDRVRIKRDQRQPLTTEPEPAVAAAPMPQGPSAVTYSGAVRRSDGKSTVWINDQPVDERSRLSNERGVNVIGMRSDGAVSLAIPEAARTATLKVGQSLDVSSGRIEEPYARRATLPRAIENLRSIPNAPNPETGRTPAQTTESATPSRPRPGILKSDLKEFDAESDASPAERVVKK